MADSPEIVRTRLAAPVLTATKCVERLEVTRIVLPPGGAPGVHIHPVPVVGYVVDGRIRFQIDAQPEQELQAGAAFFEPPNTPIQHFDNASTVEPATFIACYLLGEGDRELIRML